MNTEAERHDINARSHYAAKQLEAPEYCALLRTDNAAQTGYTVARLPAAPELRHAPAARGPTAVTSPVLRGAIATWCAREALAWAEREGVARVDVDWRPRGRTPMMVRLKLPGPGEKTGDGAPALLPTLVEAKGPGGTPAGARIEHRDLAGAFRALSTPDVHKTDATWLRTEVTWACEGSETHRWTRTIRTSHIDADVHIATMSGLEANRPAGALERAARVLVRTAFGDARDKSGRTLVEHAEAVLAQSALETDAARAVALLHDVLEDTEIAHTTLTATFPDAVVRDVETLTHRAHETYRAYIERIATEGSPTARAVKRADLRDHLVNSTADGRSPITASLRARYLDAAQRLARERGGGTQRSA